MPAPTAPHPPAGALDGIRVLEIGTLIAGPFAGRLLGDQGADVVKVEAPDRPDPLRTWGQVSEDGRGFFWTVHARNKRCITLDLRQSRGQELFLRLVEEADVVVESFRPGTMERWGLGYDQLSEVNPGVVLARVSGYGQTGPAAHRPGYASVAEALAGLRYVTGFPGQPPVRMALSLGDSLAGMFAAQGILSALVARQRTGMGQVVDTALTDSCLALTESMLPDYDRAGLVRQPSGTRLEGIAPSNSYQTSDGTFVIIAANQDTLFRRLCGAMGRPELADDDRFATHGARGRNQDELDRIIAAWAREHDSADVQRLLDEAGVAAGPVNTVADIVADPQFRARGMVLAHHDEGVGADVLGPGITPKLSATPGGLRWAGPPRPGSHNAEVYGELLGLDATALAGLSAAGVV
ncbi:formyl-CoA transferase [Modestobacter sp. DSM 44400]|uniref:CaiB/BaiF CoA transferase family protein n=1 Tax=Modestobacter sp. DSM 44400 TaxID=1550230 RepID=UPI0008982869|nr:CoA transferase [Modestobacter sp. DSM 44400]SDY46824.1 formyl-CoA transferase [Modestobacter sp. DSM 44400]